MIPRRIHTPKLEMRRNLPQRRRLPTLPLTRLDVGQHLALTARQTPARQFTLVLAALRHHQDKILYLCTVVNADQVGPLVTYPLAAAMNSKKSEVGSRKSVSCPDIGSHLQQRGADAGADATLVANLVANLVEPHSAAAGAVRSGRVLLVDAVLSTRFATRGRKCDPPRDRSRQTPRDRSRQTPPRTVSSRSVKAQVRLDIRFLESVSDRTWIREIPGQVGFEFAACLAVIHFGISAACAGMNRASGPTSKAHSRSGAPVDSSPSIGVRASKM